MKSTIALLRPGALREERGAPVSALAYANVMEMTAAVERNAHQISPEALKRLVHLRLKLEKAQGWGVFSAFAGAFVGIYALSGHLRSELLLGLYAAVTASLAAGSAPVIERAGYHYFLRRAHREGLSDVAARALYHRAASAGPWLDVLRSLGREPLEGDLVRFVTDETAM